MGTLRVRMKFYEHEFEADGAHDVVRAELAFFKNLIAGDSRAASAVVKPQQSSMDLSRLMENNQGIVLLKMHTESLDEALLLLLWGHKQFRNEQKVTGQALMYGLRLSGLDVKRLESLLPLHLAKGNIEVTGNRRARRYQLTDRGFAKAQQLVQNLLNG